MAFALSRLAELEAIFFDLDGTLVTSTLDFVKIRAELNVQKDNDIIKHLDQLPEPEATRVKAILDKHEAADAAAAEALTGAQDLLDYCRSQQWPIAIITRNSRAMAELKLQKSGLETDVLISREDAPPKPDPQAMDALLATHGLKPENVMYLGDYLFDIQAARNSGMIAGLIDHGQELHFAQDADVLVSSLPELLMLIQDAAALNAATEQRGLG